MHKSYQPINATHNKLLQRRWDMTRYDTHRRKVNQAAAVIDNKAPNTYSHLHLKLKKLQNEEERLAMVERDNKILLEKMSNIMRTRGRVDNRNDYEQKSLNKSKRQRELLKVSSENKAIMKRIAAKEPQYNHLMWEEDWRNNQQYMDNIAKYPQGWGKEGRKVCTKAAGCNSRVEKTSDADETSVEYKEAEIRSATPETAVKMAENKINDSPDSDAASSDENENIDNDIVENNEFKKEEERKSTPPTDEKEKLVLPAI